MRSNFSAVKSYIKMFSPLNFTDEMSVPGSDPGITTDIIKSLHELESHLYIRVLTPVIFQVQ